jgi:regulator of sigma E protease
MSYVLAFLGFVSLIVLHEAGHFLAAKAVGMRVERFSLFFGPMPLKRRRGETEYGIGVIPLGGYVKITGMNPNEVLPEVVALEHARADLDRVRGEIESAEAADGARAEVLRSDERSLIDRVKALESDVAAIERRAYYRQPVWKRIVVIAAGPAVNLLIAFLIIWGVYLSQGHVATSHGQAIAAKTIAPGSLEQPAAKYLKAGDQIVGVDGKQNLSVAQITKQIGSHRCPGAQTAGCHAATPVSLTVRRAGKLDTFAIFPRYDAGVKRMRVGFGFNVLIAPDNVISASGRSISQLWYWTSKTASTFARIFEPKERKQLHSIVGVYTITQEAVGLSATAALTLLALISLSLAVINLFPFLPLDGGHIFWALAEKIRGRRIPFSVMERAGALGFVLILFIFVIGFSNDISTLTGSGFHIR